MKEIQLHDITVMTPESPNGLHSINATELIYYVYILIGESKQIFLLDAFLVGECLSYQQTALFPKQLITVNNLLLLKVNT